MPSRRITAGNSRGTRRFPVRWGRISISPPPCHARECTPNEHTSGLVHQHFPKGTDLYMVTASRVRAVEDRISHRPRKVPGYRTPAEVFTGVLAHPDGDDIADMEFL